MEPVAFGPAPAFFLSPAALCGRDQSRLNGAQRKAGGLGQTGAQSHGRSGLEKIKLPLCRIIKVFEKNKKTSKRGFV